MRAFHLVLPLLVLTSPRASRAQDDLPGPPSQELADPDQHQDAAFGTDVSLVVGGGTMLGTWALPAPHTSLGLRFDAFMQDAATPGPRLGLSIFGERAMGVLPQAQEGEGEDAEVFPFDYNHFGALCVLRSDPALPWGANAGLGFSRLDLEPAYGTFPVPVLIFEGGARRAVGKVPGAAFLDLGLRAGWTQLPLSTGALEDLWTLQLSLGLGAHVR